MPIKVKIDVTKIVKEYLFKGSKGTYLDCVLWGTPDSKFGDDYRVTQDVPKEARDAGVKGEILGNAKKFGDSKATRQGDHSSRPQSRPTPPPPKQPADDGESIPF